MLQDPSMSGEFPHGTLEVGASEVVIPRIPVSWEPCLDVHPRYPLPFFLGPDLEIVYVEGLKGWGLRLLLALW